MDFHPPSRWFNHREHSPVQHRTAVLIQFSLSHFLFTALSWLVEIIEHWHRDIIELWKTCTTSRESCNARPRNRSQFRIAGKSIISKACFHISIDLLCYFRKYVSFCDCFFVIVIRALAAVQLSVGIRQMPRQCPFIYRHTTTATAYPKSRIIKQAYH